MRREIGGGRCDKGDGRRAIGGCIEAEWDGRREIGEGDGKREI